MGDFEHRVDSFGNSMVDEAKTGHVFYSTVEDSFYFHWRENESSSIWEIWMDAIPGNYTQLENGYSLMADNGLAGLGLWTAQKLKYETTDERILEYNDNMWPM